MSLSPDWFDNLPKIELHLHLEGAVPLDTLWMLVQKYGEPGLAVSADLAARFTYRDFPHFIETWVWKNNFLREYEDFTFIAEAVARDLAAQNIRYVEAFYSPSDFSRHGLTVQGITESIRRGLERVPETQVWLVADLVRDMPPGLSARTLSQVNEVRGLGVIGIGLGGSEQKYPPELFTDVFAEARRLGFHTTAHAGEAAGPASVWGALRSLRAERIGHGVHAVEDPALMDYLAEHQIPVEMCPGSNVCTGSVASMKQHPVRQFFERGILISINTDDPKMFGNSLAGEYRTLVAEFGFTRAEIEQLVRNAARSAWAEPSITQRLW